jgi:RNA polymerase sigma factor (sigma-70 family)
MGEKPAEFDRDATAAKYLPRVLAYARRLCGRHPTWTEDIEGEAVVGLAKALRNYKGGDFQTFCMTVVRRRCRRKLGRLRRQAAERPAVVPLADHDQPAGRAEVRRELHPDTLKVLTPKLRKVVEMFAAGHTLAQIGEALGPGVKEDRVRQLLTDAALRVRYGVPEDEAAPNLFDEESS